MTYGSQEFDNVQSDKEKINGLSDDYSHKGEEKKERVVPMSSAFLPLMLIDINFSRQEPRRAALGQWRR